MKFGFRLDRWFLEIRNVIKGRKERKGDE